MIIPNAQPKRRQAGSALLISVLTVMIIGLTLASYLMLVSSQNASVMQSLAWNATVPVLEAGFEEALAHIESIGVTAYVQDSSRNVLQANGWRRTTDGWFMKTRALGDGSAFVARIQPNDPPLIESTGIMPRPIAAAATVGTTESSILAAAQNRASFIVRTARVNTRRDSLFARGMVARGTIDINGNNVATDSFDSGDPMYSGPGGIYDSTKTKSRGDIATNSGLTDSLDVGNANITGSVATGPGGSVAIGPNGVVGDRDWVRAGNKGIQPGHLTADMNVSFPEVTSPFTTGPIPTSGSVGGTNYDLVIGAGNSLVPSLGGKVIVTGNATVYVRDTFSMASKDFVYLAPGATLTMYCAAPSVKIAGQGIINTANKAENFMFYGLPSNTYIDFSGNAAFVGVIYSPYASFDLKGSGGKSDLDFVGASITDTVKMTGNFRFHYDEALDRMNASRGFIPVSWNEVNPQGTFAYSLGGEL
jgi:hypothetical protein